MHKLDGLVTAIGEQHMATHRTSFVRQLRQVSDVNLCLLPTREKLQRTPPHTYCPELTLCQTQPEPDVMQVAVCVAGSVRADPSQTGTTKLVQDWSTDPELGSRFGRIVC